MKVAVIGANGFLGRNLQEARGFSFTKFDKYSSNEIKFIDINCVESLEALKGFDVLINLAAEHKDNIFPKSKYYQTNVKGSENLCIAARKFKINKIIFISTVAVYGFASPNTSEEGKINPFNDYGKSKWMAEKVYQEWYQEDNSRNLIIIRPTVIFGEGNRGNVYTLINQIMSNKFLMIGKGENVKSLAYVKNVADFICHSLSLTNGNYLFNYVDKPDINTKDLINLVYKQLGRKAPSYYIPFIFGKLAGYFFDLLSFILQKEFSISSIRIKKFCSETSFDSKLKNANFSPKYNLEEALKKTVQHEFNNK